MLGAGSARLVDNDRDLLTLVGVAGPVQSGRRARCRLFDSHIHGTAAPSAEPAGAAMDRAADENARRALTNSETEGVQPMNRRGSPIRVLSEARPRQLDHGEGSAAVDLAAIVNHPPADLARRAPW